MQKYLKRTGLALVIALLLAALTIWIGAARYSQTLETERSYSWNFEEVGYHDLGGRAAFKMAMQQSGDRWYLYLGHFWDPGWSVVDVTDPANPHHVRFIEGPTNTATVNIQVADGLMITALERPTSELVDHMPWEMYAWAVRRALDGKSLITPGISYSEGLLIWDVSDAEKPRQIGEWRTGLSGTHRNTYTGGDIIWAAGHRPGFTGHQIVALNISDPKTPRVVGSWAAASQLTPDDDTESRSKKGYFFHGPIHIDGTRGYAPYGVEGGLIFNISDPTELRLLGSVNPFPEFGSVQGVHSFQSLGDRGFAVINSEAHDEGCSRDPGRSYTAIVDIRDENSPTIASYFPEPVVPEGFEFKHFCDRPGRSGVHNQHHSNNQPYLYGSDRFVFLAMFNAGVRLYDTIDPKNVREIGYFVPPDPKTRIGPMPSQLVAQTEDVLVDARGYVYITDKNQGLRILRVTEPGFVESLSR